MCAMSSDGLAMVPDQPVADASQDRLGFAAYAGVFTAFFLDKALTTAPERMADIEAADPQMLQRILTEIAPGTVVSKEMLARLRDGQPLGGLLDRLVRYEAG
jgi:hypothetical protein